MSRQSFPVATLLNEHNLQPYEVSLLDDASPIGIIEQLGILRAGLPVSLLSMARRSAA